tara:strand:+ start:9251 stop:10210 length:960 start_codon:yes stop_codon:yes gene_type:complete
MKILVTGAAGFIGYSFSNHLLNSKKYKIIGIDNLNNYYDPKIKKERLKLLKKHKNFKFKKIDLCNNKKINQIFKENKFDFVFHFAAQAGVRYSIDHPRKYIDANISGFFNIIENSKKYNVKRLFYASSSSVYGENTNFPLRESEKIYPKNMYGLSKKINEEISKIYNNYYSLKLIGFRFFTVYGEWGRPDMMMLKYINSHFTKKEFKLFNYGNHSRDFTYIGDVVKILELLIEKNNKLPDNDIFNICSNKPLNLNEIIKFMKKNDINPKIKKIALQQADILKTHGDNSKLLKYINYKKFADWRESLKKTIEWYKKYSKK